MQCFILLLQEVMENLDFFFKDFIYSLYVSTLQLEDRCSSAGGNLGARRGDRSSQDATMDFEMCNRYL